MNNYTITHLHTDYSLLDSCTKYTEYIDKAVEYGMTSIAFTEHGKLSGWFKKYQYCHKNNIKYIHACEVYLTKTLDEKIKDNYHTCLYAKNNNGIKELNSIISKSFNKDHFYYVNRISFDEFLNLSNNIIATSACLGSPLNYLDKNDPYYDKLIKRYDYLEIQPHNHERQISFNIDLACMASQYNKSLIVGTDTHSLNKYKAECRQIMMQRKGQHYGDEDSFDLTMKSYDELVNMFEEQNCLPKNVYLQAIENTNVLANSIEEYEIDLNLKYPILYGSREADHNKLVEIIDRKFKEKIACGAITSDQIPGFEKAIKEEMEVFTKIHMDGFMLSMSEILDWCKSNQIVTGNARGSVGGSRVAYITDIIDLNPEKWHTVFSRFANEDRVEVGDIDTDVIESDRPKIFEYVKSRFGIEKCARVSAFGTLADKSIVDTIGGALRDYYDKDYPNNNNNPYSLEKIKQIKKEYDDDNHCFTEETIKKYPEIFYYYDGLKGCIISQSIHPAGMVISPITLSDNFGIFDKDDDNCLFFDMDECHDFGLVKYDFLCLNNVKIIKDTFNYLNKSYPKSYEINWDDQDVWNDIISSQYGIFQFESDMAFNLLKKMKPTNLFELSLVTAAVRPSGASYREDLCNRIIHDNKSEIINEMLKDNLGYLVYQEDVIKWLQDICGFTGSEADTVRRYTTKKRLDLVEPWLPKILDGYCNKSNKPREEAEIEAKEFLKIIEDSASYMFGYNHSIAYCLISYLCAYLRYYYPIEYITSYLNGAMKDEDIIHGTELASIYGIKITSPKYGYAKNEYFYDKENNLIIKGIGSIKFIGNDIADVLYNISKNEKPKTFIDLLYLLKDKKINNKQLDILIKIGFFEQFGNINELSQIIKMFELFDNGNCKNITKTKIKSKLVENIIIKYSNGVNKDGSKSVRYKFENLDNIKPCIYECQDLVFNCKMKDVSEKDKIKNYLDYLGYVPSTNKESDRRKLIITDIIPNISTKGKIWQYRVDSLSLGSGKTSRLSIRSELYNKKPINKNDIIYVNNITNENGYYKIVDYDIIDNS